MLQKKLLFAYLWKYVEVSTEKTTYYCLESQKQKREVFLKTEARGKEAY